MAHPQTYSVYIISVTYTLSEVEHVMGARDFNTREWIVCLNSLLVNTILKFAKQFVYL